jgi:AraC-like DNA-binding protein
VAYAEIQPTAALRPWVECFWTSRDEADSGERWVLPDGCADLVFDLKDGEGMAVGTMTKPLVVPVRAGDELLGVRFRPGRAAAFLRLPLAEITDARVPLRDLWREYPLPLTVASLERVLLERLDPDHDPRVDAAIDRILRGAGRIEDIAGEIGISRQHLARKFLHHVGVSPKTFARVMRFRRVLTAVDGDADWADLAVAHGYYDQSHLIADFRELAGATPNAFHFSNR